MLDSSALAKQFDRGEEVYFSFQYLTRDIEVDINSLLAKVLSRIDMAYLYDTFESVVRELVQNAMKANMKRVSFKEMKLDINNGDDYQKGMRKFKKVVYRPELLRERLLASPFRIVIKLHRTGSGVVLEISNNARVLPVELDRMMFRARKAAECGNFAEAYENMYDESEGAGLGIILSVMLLKNAGIDTGNFSIRADGDLLKIAIVIPSMLKGPEITSEIGNRILDDVKTLPTFPENILELRSLCNNPDTSIEALSDKISLDPSLAADVLRLSNSAGFITGKRINKIGEAIMVIGMKNLESLLVASASRKILDKRYRKFEQVWDHCNKTAYYARRIALENGCGKLADTVFIAGLLHDIGKIVLLSTDLPLVEQISDIVRNRKIRTTTILEEIYIGMSHSTIGSLIAEKWNFPDELVESIRYHHAPLHPEIVNRDTVMIVYLANQLCYLEAKGMDLMFFEADVLARFGIHSRDELDDLARRLQKRYYLQEKLL
ncbi:MAG: HDOD domain-containing protein [Spirochaetes bacterium]|nr:HDOD domain-containing protein [Spirochaetota bacterium]